jgi:hypothetical protein
VAPFFQQLLRIGGFAVLVGLRSGIIPVLAAKIAIGRTPKDDGRPLCDQTCVACYGRDLRRDGPYAYTCRTCGYTGGDGFRPSAP